MGDSFEGGVRTVNLLNMNQCSNEKPRKKSRRRSIKKAKDLARKKGTNGECDIQVIYDDFKVSHGDSKHHNLQKGNKESFLNEISVESICNNFGEYMRKDSSHLEW